MSESVFVYGTLMRGLSRAQALAGSQFLGYATALADMYDIGDFPGIVTGEGRVLGEVYQVEQGILAELDNIEGYDAKYPSHSLYLRKLIEVKLTESGSLIQSYAYFFNLPVEAFDRIRHGNYREYLASAGLTN